MSKRCSCPMTASFPVERQAVTDKGIKVPLTDSPLIGSAEERALGILKDWRRAVPDGRFMVRSCSGF
jgi:hypothetical protein